MRTPEQYRDDYPYDLADARAEAREMAGDLMADVTFDFEDTFPVSDDEWFDDLDYTQDDIDLATECFDGTPIPNACLGCKGPVDPELAGSYFADKYGWLCEKCDRELYDQFDEPPCCSLCDGVGHGYPGGGPCWLENYEYNDGTDGINN